jgi:hypothetical protein
MKNILIATAIIISTITPSYAGHNIGPKVGQNFGRSVGPKVGQHFGRSVGPKVGQHFGRDFGIGAGLLGLGIVGAIILNNQQISDECLIGYDRFGRPVYDNECFE